MKYLILLVFISNVMCRTLPQRTLDALARALDFVYSDCEDFNVDGVFGVTLAEAHLEMLLKEDFKIFNKMKVEEVKCKAAEVRKMSQDYIPEKPYKYWVFKKLISIPSIWKKEISYKHSELNRYDQPLFPIPFNVTTAKGFLDFIQNSTFSENQSDQCLVEEASVVNHTTPHECPLSENCRKYLFSQVDSTYQAYGATHRLLYLQIGRARNCTFDTNKLNNKILELCSYIFWETQTIRNFDFIPKLIDLLFEQLLLCGYEGYEEFFNTDYLLFTLKAQHPSGCYSTRPYKQWKEKRESQQMYNDCSSHTTGLAIGLMASFLRYFVLKQQHCNT